MKKITFRCPCGRTVAAPAVAAGRKAKCPHCGASNIVPAAGQAGPPEKKGAPAAKGRAPAPERRSLHRAPPASADDSGATTGAARPARECPFCGERILLTATKCKHCGSHLGLAGETGDGALKARPGETLGMFMLVIPAAVTLVTWLWFMNIAKAGRVAKLHWLVGGTIAVTALFAAIEAIKLGMGKAADVNREGKRRSGPIAWFFFVVLLWPVCYPAYLRHRRHYRLKSLMALGVLIVLALTATYCYWSPAMRENILRLYEWLAGLVSKKA